MRITCSRWLYAIVLTMLQIALFAQVTGKEQAFSISRSSAQGIQLRFDLPTWELESTNKNGEQVQKIKVADTPYLFIDESETLPVFSTQIAIPYSGGASLRILNTANQTRQQIKADFSESLTAERNSGRFTDLLYPNNIVNISQPQVIRDYRIVTVNVYPFQYDQINQKLHVNQSIDIQIDYNSLPSVNEISPPQQISRAFESIYRGLILNYEETLTRNTVYQNPVMLVIFGNSADPIYQGKVNEYIAWKKQKGYKVFSASTTVAGTTSGAIKTYIQNTYNNPATKPDYIVLIGDVTGSMPIPSVGTYADYQYTWLAGADVLGDAVIGRISVRTTEELVNYIAKMVSLERDINIESAAWLNKMVLVGDTASSGISTIYTNRYIRDLSIVENPNYTYSEIYNGSPSSTLINAAINQGVAFYNYRGYIGMSNWPGTMSSMFNGNKLFHAVFITCATGNFNSDSTIEDVVRYGSEASLGGAVTAIGMATSSTHTPMNNCLDVGIFHNIYPLGNRDMGTAMLYGKLYLDAIYGDSNPSQAEAFAGFCNLIGDPTAAVYVGIPNTFNVSAPSTISSGTTNIGFTIRNSANELVEGASVVLTDSNGQQIMGFTDASGFVLLNTPPTQSLSFTLTVSKDDFKPAISTISVVAAGGIVYDSAVIDDATSGNGDGILNSGEEVSLYVTLKNTTAGTVLLSADASCNDPYVNMIVYDRIEFNSMAPNAYGENESPIVFSVDPNCPDNHSVVLSLFIEGSSQNWTVNVPLIVRNGNLSIASYSFVGSTGNIINPGNVFPMTFSLTNTGTESLSGINAVLRSYDSYFSVQDSLGYYGTIAANATVSNTTNRFEVYARGACVDGMTIPMELYLYNAAGFSQTLSLTLTIGQTGVADPLGQDAYGYFIFDEGDTGYAQCPTYQWVPIAPAEGGSGTILSLTDPGSASDEGDQVGAVSIQTVTLPFAFKFYGESYTQASISSNGFIAFGTTLNSDWRNWRMPGAGGPNPMIAAFWDDLQLGTGSGVYTYYNSSLHYYVVEWYNMISGYDRISTETFQAILYDPVFYPTQTNDGQVKLQYKVFNNIDMGSGDTHPHGNYSTIGIKDHNGTVGLEYTFNNSYPTAAAQLTHESALFISTRALMPDNPHLVIQQVNVIDANSNGHLEPGETASLSIQLRNSGLTNATNVSAVLSSSDPYITINTANASYGNIPAETSVNSLSNYNISVAANCPAERAVMLTLTISASGDTWIYNFTEVVRTPHLEFGSFSFSDNSGNGNGSLDPGETITITIPINNTGLVASPGGNAYLSCTTTGISIVNGSAVFSSVSAGGTRSLVFSLSAASNMNIGVLANLAFSATAGTYSATSTGVIEIGAPTIVTVGNGTETQSYPLDRYYNYSAHEAIYLASEIGIGGMIKAIGYDKESGADLDPIEAVSIYMKHSSDTNLGTGAYSLTGYTLVYSGTFTNSEVSGWMEVNLDTMFEYSGTQNLAILIVKGMQQWNNSYPNWKYVTTESPRARQNHSDSEAPTNLSATNNLPNLRLKMFPAGDLIFPPTQFTATPSNRTVTLSWQAPVSGTPDSYNIYRDGVFLANEPTLEYYDIAVVNGTTYSYYATAVYGTEESDATPVVQATPSGTSNSFAILGGGTSTTGNQTGSPINMYYKSLHGQAVYTALELNAAGIYGPISITQLGFNVVTSPSLALPSFVIRMKHTTAANVASWQTAAGMQTVYSNTSYMPVSGGYHMLTLTTPFSWNGTDNIVVDTAFGLLASYSETGTMQYTSLANGYRYSRNDYTDQTNVFTGGSTSAYRPNIKIVVPAGTQGANISVPTTPLNFGALEIGSAQTLQISIQNTGNQVLAGTFTLPEGYSIAASRMIDASGLSKQAEVFFASSKASSESIFSSSLAGSETPGTDRDAMRFAIDDGASQIFYITFQPSLDATYNGNLNITTNSISNSTVNIPLTGSGYLPSLASPVVNLSSVNSSVTLNWAAVPRATEYRIYKSESPYGPFELLTTTAQIQYSDVSGDKGFYYVKAVLNIISK